MPELPEVEAARRAIEDHCIGKKIKRTIVADDSKVIDGVSSSEFESALLGKTIVAALRKGKNLWLQLDSPPFPSFQFGMAGAIYIKGVAVTKYKRSAVKDSDEWPSKYSKVFVQLDDGLEFSFTDKRRFAKVRLLKDPASVPPICELGPDALLDIKSVDDFVESLSKKKTAIKALLLDQSFISGIGNWVADEVLYQAKIHPLQISSGLSRESCATLYKCIKEVIEKAIEVGADSSQYPNNWIFHSREKKPGKAFVDGKKIEFITAGGRTTAFVPDLQKLSGNQAAKAVNKLQKQSDRKRDHRDDDVDEPASDEDKVAESVKMKKGMKSQGPGKKVPSKRKSKESDSDDVNEPESEEDKIAISVKPKKVMKPRGQGKKFPSKRKSNESDEDDFDEPESDEDKIAESGKLKKGMKARGQGKKVPSKRSKESDDDDSADEDQKKVESGKRLNAKKVNNKKIQTGKNVKNSKKKAK